MMGLITMLLLVGCGSREEDGAAAGSGMRLTEVGDTDTTGLAEGEALLTEVEPYRMENGALRVRGALDFPDGARLQISIYDAATDEMVSRFQTRVRNRKFDSPPVLGRSGPLPAGMYRFEFLSHFNPSWQSSEVLDATDDGRNLRGPGVTRDRLGVGAFYLIEEREL